MNLVSITRELRPEARPEARPEIDGIPFYRMDLKHGEPFQVA